MQYISTRGQAPALDFAGVLLAGLAEDGGLYVPDAWPHLSHADLRALRGLPYHEVAARVLRLFVGNAIPSDVLHGMTRDAYAGFRHPAVVPLVQLDADLWTQELFHGPTLAFKDLAMQVLGRMFDYVLAREGRRVTIVGATSGDTGSAAIEACRDRRAVDVVILHPQGRTSEVQRRQMTTVQAPNIANIAVDGTFDDCQDLVKAMFADAPFRRDLCLSAVNSINWARIAAQVPYYVFAALALGAPEREVAFSVPTGNFGNVLAAWAARRMGVPIARLIVASNRNDILARFLDADQLDLFEREVDKALSIEPNFAQVYLLRAATEIKSARYDSALANIAAARALPCRHVPVIAAATAHPAKFPDAMQRATGLRPPLPPALADLYERTERFTTAPNSLDAVEAQVRAFSHRNAA